AAGPARPAAEGRRGARGHRGGGRDRDRGAVGPPPRAPAPGGRRGGPRGGPRRGSGRARRHRYPLTVKLTIAPLGRLRLAAGVLERTVPGRLAFVRFRRTL